VPGIESQNLPSGRLSPRKGAVGRRIPNGCVVAWTVGFLLVPCLVVLDEEYKLELPGAILVPLMIASAVAFGLAIGMVRISIAARVGLFLLTFVLWWAVNLGVFVLWRFHPG